MKMNLKTINQTIDRHKRFLVLAHENPDGDAIGASLALGLGLREMGKEAVVYNADAVPANLAFLPKVDQVVHSVDDISSFDVIFALDCGAVYRLGPLEKELAAHPNLVNIDHHQTNDKFGAINLVVPEASSAGELIFQIFEDRGHPMSVPVASSLFAAIYTDTLALSTPSSTPEAFRICAELVRVGIDTVQIAVEYYFRQTEKRVRLLGRALSKLKVEKGGEIAGISLTDADFEATGTGPDDMEGFIEYPRNIGGVEVAYLLREEGERVKGSMRSVYQVDVAAIAEAMGGGGHKRAAGFKTVGDLESVRAQVISKIQDALDRS